MHLMSKKELSSEEMDILRMSRTPTVVLHKCSFMILTCKASFAKTTATIDQRWEEYYQQDGQLRSSCRSRVIH